MEALRNSARSTFISTVLRRKEERGERTLVRVLLVNELLVEPGRGDRFEEEPRGDEELSFGVGGVEDEGFVLLASRKDEGWEKESQ
jgi:hypothetical protein